MKYYYKKSGICYLLKILLLTSWFPNTLSEVAVKESKVDPFSLMLNNQRQILENMKVLMAKVSDLSSLEQKVALLTRDFRSANDDLVKKMNVNFLQLNGKIDMVSKSVSDLTRYKDLDSFNCGFITAEDFRNFTDMVIVELRGKNLSCNVSSTSATHEKESEKVDIKIITDDLKGATDALITEGPPEISATQSETFDDEATTDDNENEETNKFDCTSKKDGHFMSELKLFINRKMNSTYDQLLRVLSLLHNIEYRQHISSVSQDRRLNILLNKIVVHENVLENRLVETLKNEFNISIDSLKKMASSELLRGLSKNPQILRTTSFPPTVSIKCNENDSKCMSVSEETSPTTDTFSYPGDLGFFSSTLPPEVTMDTMSENVTTNVVTSSPPETESSTEDDGFTTHPVVSFLDYRLLRPRNIISKDSNEEYLMKVTSNDALSPEEGSYDDEGEANDNEGEANDDDKKTKQIHMTDSEVFQHALKYISKSLKNQMNEIEILLSRRMNAAEDKLTGIRIHQASSFYSHSKEIRYEMEKMELGLSETIRTTGSKLSKKLDGARKSLLTFIDAAVTSISSAAVTSAHSTGMQVARQLRQAMQEIAIKMSNRNNPPHKGSCPEMYQKVGSTCLLALPEVASTWTEGCKICQTVGGAFVAKEENNARILKTIKHFGFSEIWLSDHAHDATADCSQYADIDNSGELSNSVHRDIKYHRHKDVRDCPSLFYDDVEPKMTPCNKKLGVVCQYQKCLTENVGKLTFNISRSPDTLEETYLV